MAISKAHKKTSASLIYIRQGRDEPQKSYLATFNQVALEIKDLPPPVDMPLILIGLKLGDFSKFLSKKPTKIMTELLAQLTKFIKMEEVKSAKRQADRP